MEKDNRQAALNQLLAIAASNGYVTFDDIMRCADDNSLSHRRVRLATGNGGVEKCYHL